MEKPLYEKGEIMRKKQLDEDKIREDYLSELSIQEVAKLHRTNNTRISQICRGIVRRAGRKLHYNPDDVAEDYKAKMKIKDIQKKHKINSVNSIYNILSNRRITRNNVGEEIKLYSHEFKFNSYESPCFLPENFTVVPKRYFKKIRIAQ